MPRRWILTALLALLVLATVVSGCLDRASDPVVDGWPIGAQVGPGTEPRRDELANAARAGLDRRGAVRRVRIRRGLRQEDLAGRAGVSQDTVSRLEHGRLGGMTVDRIRAIGAAVGVLIDLEARWHGGELDRLLGARHSALHEAVAARFATLVGWTIAPEVTFSEYGERGAIDILAWHAPTRTVLVIELKTEIVDVQELLGTLDRKRRLARKVALDRGWDAAVVATWVILSEHRTNRRRVDAHRSVLRTALPADGRAMSSWLQAPRGPIAALSFWPRNDGVRRNSELARTERVRDPRRAAWRQVWPACSATQRWPAS